MNTGATKAQHVQEAVDFTFITIVSKTHYNLTHLLNTGSRHLNYDLPYTKLFKPRILKVKLLISLKIQST